MMERLLLQDPESEFYAGKQVSNFKKAELLTTWPLDFFWMLHPDQWLEKVLGE